MLYEILRPIVRWGLQLYFKHIFVSGLNKIPENEPVILSCNHQSAFFEPILLAVLLERKPYFITRGDIFEKSWANRLLSTLNMIPIFRFRDGMESMKKNDASLAKISHLLSEKQTVVIFSEGHISTRKLQLDPLQKGTARLAVDTFLKYKTFDTLYFVPIGLNYSNAEKPFGVVMIEVGDPYPIQRNEIETPDFHLNKKVREITDNLDPKLRERVFNVDKAEDEPLAQSLLEFYRNQFEFPTFPSILQDRSYLRKQQAILKHINQLEVSEKVKLQTTYQDVLTTYKPALSKTLFRYISLIIGFLPAVLGTIGNFIPVFFAKRYADNSIKDRAFYGPVLFALSLFGSLIYWIVLAIAALFSPYWSLFGIVLFLPFMGWYALYYWEFFRKMMRPSSEKLDEKAQQLLGYLENV